MMVLHVSASKWYVLPVTSFQWQVLNIYNSLVRFCVPVIFMISGSLFLSLDKELYVKRLYNKNILRTATALAFWSASYSVFINLYRYRTINSEVAINILKNFIVGHYHLWFLFTLLGIYIIVPFLRKICESRFLMQYFIVLSFVFTFLMNLLRIFDVFSDEILFVLSHFNFFFVLGYSGYFVLGSYLFKYELSDLTKRIIYILGLLSVIFTILATSMISINKGVPYEQLYGYLLPNTLFTSASIFLLFKDRFSKVNFSSKNLYAIESLSKLTFGMYLIHDFANFFIMRFLNITTISFNTIFAVPFISILVFLISFALIFFVKKVPILSNYII